MTKVERLERTVKSKERDLTRSLERKHKALTTRIVVWVDGEWVEVY